MPSGCIYSTQCVSRVDSWGQGRDMRDLLCPPGHLGSLPCILVMSTPVVAATVLGSLRDPFLLVFQSTSNI